MRLKEVAVLQSEYQQLLKKGITKKAMCELVIPFRDKWGLSDAEALSIARNEISLSHVCEMMNNPNQTKADRIRAMSDEELYKFCMRITHEGWPFACQHRPECNPTPPMPHWCDECFMLWLKQPVQEDDHEQ